MKPLEKPFYMYQSYKQAVQQQFLNKLNFRIMAKLEGLPEGCSLNGRLGDLVCYQLKTGENVIRPIGSIPAKVYKKDPKYSLFRKYGKGFGMCSSLASRLQRGMKPYTSEWGLPETHRQLTSQMWQSVLANRGPGGEISFRMRHLALIDGSTLNREKMLLSCGKPFRFDRENQEVSLRITYGKLQKLFGANELPLRIVLGVIAISEVTLKKEPKILHRKWHGQRAFNTKKEISAWPASGELRLKARIKASEPLPDGVGLVGVFGVCGLTYDLILD